jgi:hypothetical protein
MVQVPQCSTPLAPHTHKVAELIVLRQSICTIPERKIHGLRNISLFHPSVGGMAVGHGSILRHGLDVGAGCESVGIFFFQVIIFLK